MIKNGVSNSVFYYTMSGTGATFDISYRLDFSREPDLKILGEAVDEALKLYPEFAVRPVIHDEKIFYEANSEPAPVILDNGPVCFGSDDTNGYLFCLQCKGKSVKVSYYHGMSDTVGFFGFMRTFLYFYAKKIGMDMPEGPDAAERLGIRLGKDDVPDINKQDTLDPYRSYMKMHASVKWNYDNPGAFYISEDAYPEDDNRFHVYDLELSVKEFVAKTKEYGVSFIPLLASVISGCIHDTYDTQGKPVITMVPVNLRTAFDCKTAVNMSDGIVLPLNEEDFKMDVTERARIFKGYMKDQMEKDNYERTMFLKVKVLEAMEAENDIVKSAYQRTRLPKTEVKRPVSYALTYPGKLDLPGEFEGLLDYIYNGPLARAMMCVVVGTYKDSMQIKMVQRFDSDHLAKNILEGFRSLGLEGKLVDTGIVQSNVMDLERIKRN